MLKALSAERAALGCCINDVKEKLMEVQTAFHAGVQGFHKATEDAHRAAVNIVQQTSVDRQAEQNFQSQEVSGQQAANLPSQAVDEPTGLTESVVNLKIAEIQAKASAEVIRTADENLGTLIDVRV